MTTFTTCGKSDIYIRTRFRDAGPGQRRRHRKDVCINVLINQRSPFGDLFFILHQVSSTTCLYLKQAVLIFYFDSSTRIHPSEQMYRIYHNTDILYHNI